MAENFSGKEERDLQTNSYLPEIQNDDKPFLPLVFLIQIVIEIEKHSLHPISKKIIEKCLLYLHEIDFNLEKVKLNYQIRDIKMIMGGIRATILFKSKYKGVIEKNRSNHSFKTFTYLYDIVIKNTASDYYGENHYNNLKPQKSQYGIKNENNQTHNTSGNYMSSFLETITVYLDVNPVINFNLIDSIRYSTSYLLKYCILNNIKIIVLSGDKMKNVRSVVQKLIDMSNSVELTTQNENTNITGSQKDVFSTYNKKLDEKMSNSNQNRKSPILFETTRVEHCSDKTSIYCVSNANPCEKQRLVKKIQGLGTVCYIGDGINDHMGIEQSDLGVKLGHMGTIGHVQMINKKKRFNMVSKEINRHESNQISSICSFDEYHSGEVQNHNEDEDTLFLDLINFFKDFTDFEHNHNLLLTISLFYNFIIFIVAFYYILLGKNISGEWACGGMLFSTFMVFIVFGWLFKERK